MDSERFRRLGAIFTAAARIRDEAEREAFVERACGGDARLERDVLRLLDVPVWNPSESLLAQVRAAIETAERECLGDLET